MADSSVPIRPQRSIGRSNPSRETTGGLLMSVIRSLTTSRDSADRDRERADLEIGFASCDQRLGELINDNSRNLYDVMTTFTRVLDNLHRSKASLSDVKNKLLVSQKLLHCKRDELKKLWLELVDNRAELATYEQVEQVVDLPKQVDEFSSKKHYLHAAQCCVDGLRQLGYKTLNSEDSSDAPGRDTLASKSRYSATGYGSLAKIEALSEIRNELITKKEKLFESAIDELHKHLYVISTIGIRKQYLACLSRKTSINGNENSFMNIFNESHSRKVSTIDSVTTKPTVLCDDYPEEDSKQYISMLTKCLGLLNKISEAVEIIRERCENEFIYIVIKTVQDVLTDSTITTNVSTTNSISGANRTTGNTNRNQLQFDDSLENSFKLRNTSHFSDLNINTLFNQSHKIRTLSQQQLVVLSCSPLIGYVYDGYSHIKMPQDISNALPTIKINSGDSNQVLGAPKFKPPQNSLKLNKFFQMLMLQYRSVVALHDSIVLPNLKRIESGLNSFDASGAQNIDDSSKKQTQFYSSNELWFRIQNLIQQLLDFYLDSTYVTSAASASSISNPQGNLTNFFHGNLQNFFHTGPLFNGNMLKNNVRGGGIKDYSSFFPKRRPLVAGAMNAMGAMTKNTMSAVSNLNTNTTNAAVSASAIGMTPSASLNGDDHGDRSPAVEFGSTDSADQNIPAWSGSSNMFRNQIQLFKFERSAQAMSWNEFLVEQHQKQIMDAAEKKEDEDDYSQGKSRSRAPPINKLFESLKSVAAPTIDNLVLIYALLFRYALDEPTESDLQPANITNDLTAVLQGLFIKKRPKQLDRHKNNALYEYLMSAAEKFSINVNLQLERMLESAKESLNLGTTVLIPNPIDEILSSESTFVKSENEENDTTRAQMLKDNYIDPNFSTPLLESVVLIDVSLHELFALMQVMPDFSSEFLIYMYHVLTVFKEASIQAYTNIVTSDVAFGQGNTSLQPVNSSFDLRSPQSDVSSYERKRIISANWARDEDICRLLKSLPNWLSLQENRKAMFDPQVLAGRKRFDNRTISFDESPEDIRMRNMRETEILAKNLSNEIPKQELLWQDGQLRAIAQMQESFEWLAVRCDDLINSIMQTQHQEHVDDDAQERPTPDVRLATITQLMKDFTEMSETCLLMLHLEVRVHCFYHLRELSYKFYNFPAPQMDPGTMAEVNSNQRTLNSGYELYCDDIKILPLINDLRKMYDELNSVSLKSYKMTYVFEGLGHLISTIFINSLTKVKRIKPVGVKRACRAIFDIQRRLISITKNRELALDYAREYFELLLLTPDELIASIIERGSQFLHTEYVTVMKLLYQSELTNSPANIILSQFSYEDGARFDKEALKKHLRRLEEILNETPVNI